MYVVVEFMDADPAHRVALRAALVMFAHATLTRLSSCHIFDVSQDDLDGSAFLIYQRYEDKTAYQASVEDAAYAAHRAHVDPWIKTHRTLTYECLSDAGVA